MIPDVLAGHTAWFVWNASAFEDDPVAVIRSRMHDSRASAVLLKTYDGDRPFTQAVTLADLANSWPHRPPPLVLAWGYHYGANLSGEMGQVRRNLDNEHCGGVVLNVEDAAIEADHRVAERWHLALQRLRADYPAASLYFCSHAQPKYHERQPYYQAMLASLIQMPMAYHTAMELPPADAITVSREQYTEYGLTVDSETGEPLPWSAAGAAYSTGTRIITETGIRRWSVAAIAAGATSLVWWELAAAQYMPNILRAAGNARLALDKAAVDRAKKRAEE